MDVKAIAGTMRTGRRNALASLLGGTAALGVGGLLQGGATVEARKRKRLQLAFACPAPATGEGTYMLRTDVRAAQTFTASRSGTLRRIQVPIVKPANSTGDYVVQLVRVINEVPSNEPEHVLAAVTIPDATVPEGEATLTANFAGTKLVQNTVYAAAVSRLDATGPVPLRVHYSQEGTCAGQYFEAAGIQLFTADPPRDMIVSVFVA